MKVLDLQCQHGHVFEGWFGSEDDFQSQRERGLVQCPLCADSRIEKRLSAPRLNLGAAAPVAVKGGELAPRQQQRSVGHGAVEASTLPAALQAAWLDLARKIVAQTEDVGDRFVHEARRMHHGEVPERAIRGHATPDEAMELLEEGIAVMPLPLPPAAKETLQ